MKKETIFDKVFLVVTLFFLVSLTACTFQPKESKPRLSLFIGVDASGSFQSSDSYENALAFLAYYIYGHLNELEGLSKPRALYVGSIGGRSMGEPKAFHPIHDFDGKSIEEIEEDLRTWFSPRDTLTDFNAFFEEVARISKDRNLILGPINVMVVSDGIPDVASNGTRAGSKTLYENIDLSPMEYLSRSLTVRLAYASPKVGDQWRKYVPRKRVRFMVVNAEVMKGWQQQIQPELGISEQNRLWKWVKDNVDYRVRSRRAA
ncbi:MAG TPA: hypothetical protein VGB26_01615 [Nitrospiria bacterium]|jgi:hypothetical protein